MFGKKKQAPEPPRPDARPEHVERLRRAKAEWIDADDIADGYDDCDTEANQRMRRANAALEAAKRNATAAERRQAGLA